MEVENSRKDMPCHQHERKISWFPEYVAFLVKISKMETMAPWLPTYWRVSWAIQGLTFCHTKKKNNDIPRPFNFLRRLWCRRFNWSCNSPRSIFCVTRTRGRQHCFSLMDNLGCLMMMGTTHWEEANKLILIVIIKFTIRLGHNGPKAEFFWSLIILLQVYFSCYLEAMFLFAFLIYLFPISPVCAWYFFLCAMWQRKAFLFPL